MKLIVNGEPFECGGRGALPDLLESLGAQDDQVAVLVNDEVVVRAARQGWQLQAGDRVELLTFAGGG